MHILLIANSTWNIVNFRMPVIEALLLEGHKVTVLAPPDQYVGQLSTIAGLEYEALNALNRKSTDFVSNIRLIKELYSNYKRIAPDLVIHFTVKPNIFGSFAAWLKRIPSVMVVTGLGYTFLHEGLTQSLTRVLYRLATRRASQVVFENGTDLKLFINLNLIHKPKGLVVPGCGVDITYFSPRPKSNSTTKYTVFTFVGRLLEDKGISEFVEAAQKVHRAYPNTRFRIVGNLDEDNPAHISASRLAEWRRLPGVEYLGFSDDIRQLYADTDWVVLPSYREGLSKVLLEALAMGRPIITTDTPGCQETVQPGKNGFLVPVKSAQALARAMESAANMSDQEWHTFSLHSRRKAVMEFETTIIGRFYTKLVAQILGLLPVYGQVRPAKQSHKK
jgi:glycosyltransferase involved in cell wall biosynthesis